MHHSGVTKTVWGPYDGCSFLMPCFPIEADEHRMNCQKMFMHTLIYGTISSI